MRRMIKLLANLIARDSDSEVAQWQSVRLLPKGRWFDSSLQIFDAS